MDLLDLIAKVVIIRGWEHQWAFKTVEHSDFSVHCFQYIAKY